MYSELSFQIVYYHKNRLKRRRYNWESGCLNMDLKLTGYKNNTDKDVNAVQDLQVELVDILIAKRGTQIISHKSDLLFISEVTGFKRS